MIQANPRIRLFRAFKCLLPLCLALNLEGTALAGTTAESLPQAVTIKQLLEVARRHSPRYAALRQAVELSKAEIAAADVLPNPRVNFGNYSLLSANNTMYDGKVQREVVLEVPVLISGQHGARVEAAEKQVQAIEATVQAEFAGLVHELWRTFIKLLAGQQRVAVWEETSTNMERLAALVAGREESGSASRYDVLRMEIEAKDVRAKLETARNDLQGTVEELGLMLGLPDWKPQALGNFAPLGVSADPNKAWADAERINPEIETVRRGETAAEARLEKAKAERWPVPSIQFGSAFTDQPYGHAFFGGFSVEIPLFDRNQGGMARASAEKQSAILEREFVTSRVHVALDRATGLLARRRETRARFEREVIAKLPALKEMGEAAYRLGKGTLLELLDSTRSRTEIRLTHLELIELELEAELETLRASGLLVSRAETG
ncbi:TolC family protein [Methylococcus geothermalis]|uniref:TolC family protein n=1 Tax=Methylococcus geothermalis TaxID=2681310 RepID=A0A858Q913_9GAMM|nr:TolC family protein [Methylococcus geothermalis]QJD30320.1 TolC family protein [Methylococcus geothermalis]